MAVIEWDQRELCPDGGCIGVIGASGTCSVCGGASTSERTHAALAPVDAPAGDAHAHASASDGDGDGGDDGEGDDGDDDDRGPADAPAWTERELCSDGACTGVIGDDGHCRVCGKEPG